MAGNQPIVKAAPPTQAQQQQAQGYLHFEQAIQRAQQQGQLLWQRQQGNQQAFIDKLVDNGPAKKSFNERCKRRLQQKRANLTVGNQATHPPEKALEVAVEVYSKFLQYYNDGKLKLSPYDKVCVERDKAIEERDQARVERDEAIEEKDQAIVERAIEEQEEAIEEMNEAIEKMDQLIEEQGQIKEEMEEAMELSAQYKKERDQAIAERDQARRERDQARDKIQAQENVRDTKDALEQLTLKEVDKVKKEEEEAAVSKSMVKAEKD
uniref:Uncharacterized protein n=1 Tax=Branchiostoma floridae TaxID=7739 RepID=C3YWZ0_BRAFL|eukprot:XP_002599372.1 hypothetical protein BRAFLDRAFT_117349 [Branchiostoma floridae]